MTRGGVFAALLLVGARAWSGDAVLDSLFVMRERDSVAVELEFDAGRPERFRVVQPTSEDDGRLRLRMEFQSAGVREGLHSQVPRWIRIRPGDEGMLLVEIPLRKSVSWKAAWKGRVLRVTFADEIRDRPSWANPWVIGGGVAVVVAGGAAVWFLGTAVGDQAGTTSAEPVPPPDFELPK